ncbi:MAG: MBL fold metallo-hydrolase, partial [Calditrichia bacterium]
MIYLQYLILFFLLFTGTLFSQNSRPAFATDTISTEKGDLQITFIGHGTLMFNYGGTIIHIDPVSRYADYSKLPKADLILITHHHGDHLDPQAIDKLRREQTVVIATKTASEKLKEAIVLNNGESRTIKGIRVEAVPAYNLVHKRDSGEPYHPKGAGNGY